MRPFRFRAQAALDLRRRELGAAQRELARAEEVRDAALRRVDEADEAVAAAREAAGQAQRTAGDATRLEWYRLWILRLVHERSAHAATLKAREADVDRALAICWTARQRAESLERFKEKARLAHRAVEDAMDRKTIDELATRRFTRSLPERLNGVS